MIKPRAIRKLPECFTCRFYSGNPYLFCAVMPDGLEGDFCPHFAFDPDAVPEEEELWQPQGARYINGELVLERNHLLVDGIEIIQLDLTSWHPIHTGKCPRCGATFERDYTARVHWDCANCGWMDDSV